MTDFPPILIDSREPGIHPWEQYFSAPVIRGTGLRTGDFSLPGCQEYVVVERKAWPDLLSSLSWGRKRFERELLRSTRISDFCVVVEGHSADLKTGAYRSNMSANSAWGSMIALQQRYRCPFYFLGTVQLAAEFTESFLMRWYEEHVKVIDLVRIAKKKAARAAQK
jgi:ERCC4-type nuclease